MNKGRILITGAAGFVGSRITSMLLESNFSVIGIDNLNNYYSPELKHHRLEVLTKHPQFKFLEVDIENRTQLNEIFAQSNIETVFNLAARAGVRQSLKEPQIYFSTNTLGTLNILEAMKDNNCPQLVQASTSSLYAGSEGPFTEDLPVNRPISPYAASKKAAEVLAYTYSHLYNINVSIVRYFTVYGPAGRPDMSYLRFINNIDHGKVIKLYGDGNQSRDFTYVDDIARGTILAGSAKQPYEVYNLGGGKEPVSINTLIHLIEKTLGKKAIIEYSPHAQGDMEFTMADITKAKKMLNWTPEISLQRGIEITVDWYQKNRDLVSKVIANEVQ